MGLKLFTAPASEPITLTELKAQCNVTHALDDVLLAQIISASRAMAENYTSTAIITQTWDQTLDAFPEAEIELLKPPVTAITSVSYIDTAGATQTLSNTLYTLDNAAAWPQLLPKVDTDWPDTQVVANAVTIRYVTGYASGAVIPSDMKAWLLMTGAFLYAQRESIVVGERLVALDIPSGFINSLLDPYRVWKV